MDESSQPPSEAQQGTAALLDWYRLERQLVAFPLSASRECGGTWRSRIEAYLERHSAGRARLWWERAAAEASARGDRLVEVAYGGTHYGFLELARGYLVADELPHAAADLAGLLGMLLAMSEMVAAAQYRLERLPPLQGRVHLTAREREELADLARGESLEESAAHRGVEVSTVKSHQRSPFRKLEVHRADDAVLRAGALGLIDWLDMPVLEVKGIPLWREPGREPR